MEENIITWNITNWITIVLMAVIGFLIVGTLAHGIRALIGQPSSSAANNGATSAAPQTTNASA